MISRFVVCIKLAIVGKPLHLLYSVGLSISYFGRLWIWQTMASSMNKSTTNHRHHLVYGRFYWIFQSAAPNPNRTSTRRPHQMCVVAFSFFYCVVLCPKVNKPLPIWNHLLGKFSNPLASRYAAFAIPLNRSGARKRKRKLCLLGRAHV